MTTQPPPQCILSLHSRSDYAHKVSISLKGIKQTQELRGFFSLNAPFLLHYTAYPSIKTMYLQELERNLCKIIFLFQIGTFPLAPYCSRKQKAEVMKYKQTTEKPF